MPKIPTKAILDGDIIAYRIAFWAEANDPDNWVEPLENLIEEWLPNGIGPDDYVVALSCSRPDNFRRQHWPLYKNNREASYVPEQLPCIKHYLRNYYPSKLHDNVEADDLMGVYASSHKMIAVTIDKDLRGTKGWHYNPYKEDDPVYVDKNQAFRFFCQQWLMGDATDGIPGLWRVGPKKADKWLDSWDQKDWEKNIIELYTDEKYKPKLPSDLAMTDYDVALAMARCVKILEKQNYNLRTRKITPWQPKSG